jgi:hypothetical protein
MVLGPGGNPVPSSFDRADEVFHTRGGTVWASTNSAGDTIGLVTGGGAIIPGQDVEIEGMVVRHAAYPVNVEDQGTNISAILLNNFEARTQISTRGQWTNRGGDAEIPAGVLFHDQVATTGPQAFEDETNGTGGGFGVGGVEEYHTLTGDLIDVLSTDEIDEGTAISAFAQIGSVPLTEIAHRVAYWIYVSER